MNCPKCNTENVLGAIYCENCGYKLTITPTTPEVTPKEDVLPKASVPERDNILEESNQRTTGQIQEEVSKFICPNC